MEHIEKLYSQYIHGRNRDLDIKVTGWTTFPMVKAGLFIRMAVSMRGPFARAGAMEEGRYSSREELHILVRLCDSPCRKDPIIFIALMQEGGRMIKWKGQVL